MSSIIDIILGYRAPFEVFFHLHRENLTAEPLFQQHNLTVCYGKEWHRFPTSFLLPNPSWNVRYIPSEFKGQLPGLFPPFDPEGTTVIPEHMNDDNLEEPTRYVSLPQSITVLCVLLLLRALRAYASLVDLIHDSLIRRSTSQIATFSSTASTRKMSPSENLITPRVSRTGKSSPNILFLMHTNHIHSSVRSTFPFSPASTHTTIDTFFL